MGNNRLILIEDNWGQDKAKMRLQQKFGISWNKKTKEVDVEKVEITSVVAKELLRDNTISKELTGEARDFLNSRKDQKDGKKEEYEICKTSAYENSNRKTYKTNVVSTIKCASELEVNFLAKRFDTEHDRSHFVRYKPNNS